MATRKSSYIDIDLDWAEKQLATWRAYIDDNPINELKDRIEWKSTKAGGTMPMVVASIEQQGKYIQETMRNYLALLKEVDLMREREDLKKSNPRGSQTLSPIEDGTL